MRRQLGKGKVARARSGAVRATRAIRRGVEGQFARVEVEVDEDVDVQVQVQAGMQVGWAWEWDGMLAKPWATIQVLRTRPKVVQKALPAEFGTQAGLGSLVVCIVWCSAYHAYYSTSQQPAARLAGWHLAIKKKLEKEDGRERGEREAACIPCPALSLSTSMPFHGPAVIHDLSTTFAPTRPSPASAPARPNPAVSLLCSFSHSGRQACRPYSAPAGSAGSTYPWHLLLAAATGGTRLRPPYPWRGACQSCHDRSTA